MEVIVIIFIVADLRKELYKMDFEKLIETLEALETDDYKGQALEILKKWENPDKQRADNLQKDLDSKNEEIKSYEIRVDELRKFNAETLLNSSVDTKPIETQPEDISIEDIADSF